MLRAASVLVLLASCVVPASGPYTSTTPAYQQNYSGNQAQPAYQQNYSGYPAQQQPQGYPDGYQQGYQSGYPDGYAQNGQSYDGYAHDAQTYPQQECKSAYGTTACGYGCVAAYGEVKCASQPGGTCSAAYGQVSCWEPPAQQRQYGYVATQPSECKSAYGTTACGYGCVAAYGEVKCASQPGGVCEAAYGQVTCSN